MGEGVSIGVGSVAAGKGRLEPVLLVGARKRPRGEAAGRREKEGGKTRVGETGEGSKVDIKGNGLTCAQMCISLL